MIKEVKTKDLKVGMYVKLGASWLTHSFIKPNFLITSEKQIKQIHKNGIHVVNVDTEKSHVREERDFLKDVGYQDRLKSGGDQAAVRRKGRDAEYQDRLKSGDEQTTAHPKGGDAEYQDHLKNGADVKKGADKDRGAKDGAEEGNGQIQEWGIGRREGDIETPEEEEFNPIELVTEEFRETIQNTKIPPKTKAKAVYNYSIRMMNTVLEEPTGENILHGKKLIAETVDFILDDDDTSHYLTKITSHDYYTYTHSVNVGMLAVLLAKSAFRGTLATHNMRELGAGFFLHDLGKCDVPLTLLNKPDILSPEEWKIMREHPLRGNRLLSANNALSKETGIVVMQHHEREDGSGYPYGLRGEEIHVYGRICAISDVYDALTSTRAYKKKLPSMQALKVMKDEMVNHFNHDLFNIFVSLFAET